jgi:hypothetical protein
MVHQLAGSCNYFGVSGAFHQTLQTNFRIDTKVTPQQHVLHTFQFTVIQ